MYVYEILEKHCLPAFASAGSFYIAARFCLVGKFVKTLNRTDIQDHKRKRTPYIQWDPMLVFVKAKF